MKRDYIPLSVPNLSGNELEYVTHAINTEWVSTGGPYVQKFEEAISKYVLSKGAVSCQNGTSGLHIALKVSGIDEQNEVIVPTLTFIAAVNPVKYVGANPIFMDCDDSLCLDPNKLRHYINSECIMINEKLINKRTNKHIKALIFVHVFGNVGKIEEIIDICKENNVILIEDATEALGTFFMEGKYKGKFAGTLGDIGVYSFNGNKIITTGGGGMIVSNNEEYLSHAKHLVTQAKSDELYFKHDEIGYNYRMTNLQAALGLAQLEQLEKFIAIKKENYLLYKGTINEVKGLSMLDFNERLRPNYWFYSLIIEKEFTHSRDELIAIFEKHNIQTRPIWDLINLQIPYQKYLAWEIEVAAQYLSKIINLPCSSNLKKEQLLYVLDVLKNI